MSHCTCETCQARRGESATPSPSLFAEHIRLLAAIARSMGATDVSLGHGADSVVDAIAAISDARTYETIVTPDDRGRRFSIRVAEVHVDGVRVQAQCDGSLVPGEKAADGAAEEAA